MKRFLSLILCISLSTYSFGQIGGMLNKAKKKAEEKILKDEPKKTAEDAVPENTIDEPSGSASIPSVKSYSKYDFVPGEKIIVFEDFIQDAIGDFPDKWNTNASAEIVTIGGMPGHWLKINKQGVFMPEMIDALPDNFTFEFDLLCDNPGKVWAFYTSIVTLENHDQPEHWQSAKSRFTFTVGPSSDASVSNIERRKDDVSESGSTTNTKKFTNSKSVHISIWRQKERIRVYFDEEKTWDLPKAMSKDAKYNGVVYWLQGTAEDANYYITNLRLAVGAPDTRNKILAGKWVTHGILFDVNSDKIRPESNGTLKEMANVLKENADLKVKIVGHTDSDGKDADNLDLSKRRATAVKAALSSEFGIDESRLQTDGKGESEPLDKSETPEAKANNRRVEFIKI
jgi:OmpA-OmpF porin, OOP family